MKKTKIMVLSDHPLSPSGVGTQTKYMIEALLKTGRYQFICLGGAMKHVDYSPVTVDPYGKDFLIVPVDGYGNPEVVRSALRKEKPDILWFMTDPRFYEWLWEIEDEVRALVPMVYYHVWDNFPVPMYNKVYYDSTDYVVSISKVTEEIVKTCSPDNFGEHISHAVNSEYFKKITDKEQLKAVEATKQQIYNSSTQFNNPKKKIFFWNNRNARRKQSGTLIWWFKEWLDKENLHDKASLIMHTEPKDPHGQDLEHIIEHLGLKDRQIMLSTQKMPPENLAHLYSMVDCTINISDAEGFGLATLESLSCGTPIIATMTGGLQEQVTNGNEEFGVPLIPTSKSVIGSQQVPYIYEDRINKAQFHSALTKIYKMGKEERNRLGLRGREHVLENYNFNTLQQKWVELIDQVIENRENYNGIRFKEVA